jgi:hypothetical protein
MPKATAVMLVTFDYESEVDYARTLTEVHDRTNELAKADMVNVVRGDGIAYDGHLTNALDRCSTCGRWMDAAHAALTPAQHRALSPISWTLPRPESVGG